MTPEGESPLISPTSNVHSTHSSFITAAFLFNFYAFLRRTVRAGVANQPRPSRPCRQTRQVENLDVLFTASSLPRFWVRNTRVMTRNWGNLGWRLCEFSRTGDSHLRLRMRINFCFLFAQEPGDVLVYFSGHLNFRSSWRIMHISS